MKAAAILKGLAPRVRASGKASAKASAGPAVRTGGLSRAIGWAMAGVFLLGAAGASGYLLHSETGKLRRAREADGRALAAILAQAAPMLLAEGDAARLSALLESAAREKGLLFAAALDPELRTLAHSDPAAVGQIVADDRSVEAAKAAAPTSARYRDPQYGDAMEFVAPIAWDGARLGTLRLAVADANALLRAWRGLPEIKVLFLILSLVLIGSYSLVRRFLAPLGAFAAQVSGIVRERSFAGVDGKWRGEVGDLAERWNETMALFRSRFEEMEAAGSRLEVSSRLVAYEKKKNEAILDGLSDVIVVTNATGEIVTANRQAETFLGAAKSALQGKPAQKAFAASGILDKLDFFGSGPYSNTVKTAQHTETAGAGRTFRFSATPLSTAAGKPNGHMICGRDVTAQVLSDRMKEEFVASVSHEIRTPLASIKSYIEMLMDKEIEDPKTQFEFYNTINDETERLSRLIDNLLNLSKMEAGSLTVNKGPVVLKKLLKEALRACESQAVHKDVKLELAVPETISAPEMDKDLMGVVIFNLLSNALKYTNKGGEVTLTVEEEDRDLLIKVKDTGIGIPEDALPKLFRKFYRTEQPEVRERVGSGLGLALSKQIAELHGGDIQVESRLGEGSVFTLVVPKD